MLINIRNGVFETNSSSVHSITLTGNSGERDLPAGLNEVLYIQQNEFGWGYDVLKSPLEKLTYVFTALDTVYNSPIFLKWLKELVYEKSGVILDFSNYVQSGYIDHQSIGLLDKWVLADEETFKENITKLIYSDNYIIEISNDNC